MNQFHSFVRITIGCCASLALLTACGSDDADEPDLSLPGDNDTRSTINYFEAYGNLTCIKSTFDTSAPRERYRYTFDDQHRVTCVDDLSSGERHPITYEDDRITIYQDSGVEGKYEFMLENGRITSCRKNGKLYYRWEYDSEGRVSRYQTILSDEVGIGSSYRATWADGDLIEVVCEPITDYERNNVYFGDKYTFEPSDIIDTNPFVLVRNPRRPSTSSILNLHIQPILLAEGYYGNSTPRHLPAKETFFDAHSTSDISSGPATHISETIYICDSRGRVINAESVGSQIKDVYTWE